MIQQGAMIRIKVQAYDIQLWIQMENEIREKWMTVAEITAEENQMRRIEK